MHAYISYSESKAGGEKRRVPSKKWRCRIRLVGRRGEEARCDGDREIERLLRKKLNESVVEVGEERRGGRRSEGGRRLKRRRREKKIWSFKTNFDGQERTEREENQKILSFYVNGRLEYPTVEEVLSIVFAAMAHPLNRMPNPSLADEISTTRELLMK